MFTPPVLLGALATTLAACGGEPARVDPQPEVRQAVLTASLAVRRAARARDAAVGRLRASPGGPCAGVSEAHAALQGAWVALDGAWSVAEMNPEGAAEARTARAQIAVQSGLDERSAVAWRRWCAARAPVGTPAEPEPVRTHTCGPLRVHGAVVGVAASAPLATAADTVAQLQQLSAHLDDTWDLLFVIEAPSTDRGAASAAHVAIDRGTTGLGRAPVDPRHLPRWPRLEGAVVLSAADGLADGPALREVVRVYGNRWRWAGCSPGPGGGWGLSDAGGQLGGGRPGTLRALRSGAYTVEGLRAGPAGLLANGGNTVAYAPIELYLLGLAPLGSVRPVRIAKGGSAAAEGGGGLCTLDPATIEARFGRRPARTEPWRVGLLWRGRGAPDDETLRRWRRRLWRFSTPGPDADPLRLDFWEATGGRGRLVPTPARLRPGCDATTTPLP